MKILVIGGGIAGLAAAHNLEKQAQEKGREIEITLVEAADYWGGKIKTTVEDGFVVEGGPDAYLVTKPWMRDLCKELGFEEQLHGTNPEQSETFILNDGELRSIPTGLTMTIPTEFGPLLKTKLLNISQKIRMGFDFVIPPRKSEEDESLGGFISRRLGRAAYENLVGPLLSGIYAGDGDRLSLKSTFPMFRDMEVEYGGVIKGALALKFKRAAMARKRPAGPKAPKSRSIFETHSGGLVMVVDALVDSLKKRGVNMKLNAVVEKIDELENGYSVQIAGASKIQVDALAIAAPAFVAADLLSSISPELADDLAQVDYVTTATVSLAYRKKDMPKLEGYGYIIPQNEDSKALACTWTSTKWERRAPEDFALLRVFLGRIQDAEKLPEDESELLQMAKDEVCQTMGIEIDPEISWVFRWEKAMPQFNLGHPERLKRLEKGLEAFPRLALAGNAYYGIGMPDCILSGIKAAQKLIQLEEGIK